MVVSSLTRFIFELKIDVIVPHTHTYIHGVAHKNPAPYRKTARFVIVSFWPCPIGYSKGPARSAARWVVFFLQKKNYTKIMIKRIFLGISRATEVFVCFVEVGLFKKKKKLHKGIVSS